MKACILLISSLFIINVLSGESDFDPARICEHIEVLSSDEFQGRKPGTIGEKLTLEYLTEAFEEIGLEKPDGHSFLQKVVINKCNIRAPRSIELLSDGKSVSLERERDYLMQSSKPHHDAFIEEVDFVFAGFGIHAPELDWDDYKNVDVKGKVVIVLADVPGEYTTDTLLWKGDPAANIYSKGFYKRNEAAKRGAVGLLTIFKQSKQGFYSWESLANYIGKDDQSINYPEDHPLLEFSGLLSIEAMSRILSLSNLEYQDCIDQALAKTFEPIDLHCSASFVLNNDCEQLETYNVVAMLPGSDLKDECMIYSAHWDHVGMNPAAGTDSIFNGAVDNASGTAALIEIARQFKTQGGNRRSILFLATTAEEMGLLGSIWYNTNPIFPISKTAANFNMDFSLSIWSKQPHNGCSVWKI